MGLFDFLNGKSDNQSIDLSDIKFISNDHVRYQNGKDVSGHNSDCWRGIRVQNNISGGQGYTVTIYNLDGNHPVWGNNIQMAPKQMKIVEQTNIFLKLRGFGYDPMGNSFADHGLTLNLNNKVIEKMTLHMYDRNIDIVYFKANYNESQQNQSATVTQTIPMPSSNIIEIMALSEVIHKCQDLAMLNHVYNREGNYNHPQVCYDFGVAFLIKGDKINAKKALIQGAIYGIKYPCSLYGNPLVDSVGQCFSILMIQFPIADNSKAFKVTALGYIYLSRCIELYLREAQDSYKTRAQLFNNHENSMIVQSLIMDNVGLGILVEPYIISDFYFASQASDSPHRSLLQRAMSIHQGLQGIKVGGKDADDYSLTEMADFGEKRHLQLFKTLEQKYKSGAFDLTTEELINAIK